MFEPDEDMRKKALANVLQEIIDEMNGEDAKRMKAEFVASSDGDSEEPIDPKNIDASESEAEEEGGHPGMVSADKVDNAESEKKNDEDEELKKHMAFRPRK